MITRDATELRKVSDVFASAPSLSDIRNHIEKLNKLQIKLHRRLSEPLREHATVANCRQGTLVLHARNAAWASKLRFESADLLAAVTQDADDIRTVRVKVAPPAIATGGNAGTPARISTATARRICRIADTIADPALRATLRSIAKNAV